MLPNSRKNEYERVDRLEDSDSEDDQQRESTSSDSESDRLGSNGMPDVNKMESRAKKPLLAAVLLLAVMVLGVLLSFSGTKARASNDHENSKDIQAANVDEISGGDHPVKGPKVILNATVIVDNKRPKVSEENTHFITRDDLSLTECIDRKEWSQYGAPPPEKCFNFSLLLLKGQKTGSSTSGGVARRIAARYGLGCVKCSAKGIWDHEPNVIAPHIPHAVRHVKELERNLETFSFGMMRHPISRCLSQFYHFAVSRHHNKPTPAHIIAAGNRSCHNQLTRYYDLNQFYDEVDFLGTTERYAESLLLLGYTLGITMGDLLYTKAKDSSKNVKDVTGQNHGLTLAKHVPIDEQPQEVQDFFHGPFMEKNQKEYYFWKKAGEDMDAKIDLIGRENFETKVNDFKRHLKAIDKECDAYDSEGNLKPGIKCYWRDNGCNFPCFDRYATEHGLWDEILVF